MSVPALRQSHVHAYLERMEAGLKDKLFFVEQLPKDCEVLLDIGCANGTVLKGAHVLNPYFTCIGFDESDQLLSFAKKQGLPKDSLFTSDFYEATDYALELQEAKGKKFALVLSSVLHELQTYLNYHEKIKFWEELADLGADYIVIRDMGMDNDEARKLSNSMEMYNIHHFSQKNNALAKALNSFLGKYRDINTTEKMVHWLLKYHYLNNWDRELEEDYIVSLDEVMDDLAECGYHIIHFEQYTHPWIKERVQRDYHFNLKHNTHFKIVAERIK